MPSTCVFGRDRPPVTIGEPQPDTNRVPTFGGTRRRRRRVGEDDEADNSHAGGLFTWLGRHPEPRRGLHAVEHRGTTVVGGEN